MSSTIGWEARFWLYAVALGAFLLLLYDCLRVIRRVFPHRLFAISLEDFFYWMISGGLIFRMLYQFNHGIIRWFTVLGMLVGMSMYRLTISGPFVKIASKWFRKTVEIIGRPFVWVFEKLHKKMANFNSKRKKVTNSLKKKLKRKRKACNMEIVTIDRRETVGEEKSQKKSATTTE